MLVTLHCIEINKGRRAGSGAVWGVLRFRHEGSHCGTSFSSCDYPLGAFRSARRAEKAQRFQLHSESDTNVAPASSTLEHLQRGGTLQ